MWLVYPVAFGCDHPRSGAGTLACGGWGIGEESRDPPGGFHAEPVHDFVNATSLLCHVFRCPHRAGHVRCAGQWGTEAFSSAVVKIRTFPGRGETKLETCLSAKCLPHVSPRLLPSSRKVSLDPEDLEPAWKFSAFRVTDSEWERPAEAGTVPSSAVSPLDPWGDPDRQTAHVCTVTCSVHSEAISLCNKQAVRGGRDHSLTSVESVGRPVAHRRPPREDGHPASEQLSTEP